MGASLDATVDASPSPIEIAAPQPSAAFPPPTTTCWQTASEVIESASQSASGAQLATETPAWDQATSPSDQMTYSAGPLSSNEPFENWLSPTFSASAFNSLPEVRSLYSF